MERVCSACGITKERREMNRWQSGMINRSVSAQSNLPQDVAEAEKLSEIPARAGHLHG